MSNVKQIESLIQLLDDPDFRVFEAVKSKLYDFGEEVLPFLEKAWDNSLDNLLQTRIENIMHSINFDITKKKLKLWANESEPDLFAGALIIALFQYPDMDANKIVKEFEDIKTKIWIEINEQFTALEKVRIMNHILYNIFSFSRSNTFHRSVQSHFINNTLVGKKGSPISLAILYAALGQHLGMPIYGVSLAKNFIVGYKTDESNIFRNEFEYNVLFYVNPFNKGIAFGKKEVDEFVKNQKLEHKISYFKPCSNKQTIIELLKTIIEFYSKDKNEIKMKEYEDLLNILYF